ncbi:MAG: tyrosine--tRNA ligase [Candidatus Falkowbacteria bacterium]
MPKINVDAKKIEELLTRGVENIFPAREFLEEKLKSGKQLRIYLGIDPTGPSLHLGHAISLMKLRQFQELGHKIIMLIGSFTAMIGDPTDKLAMRKPLTREQVLKNCENYKKQASALIKFDGANPAEIKFNGDWLDKLTFKEIIDLASHFTVQQMLSRDMFRKRMHWKKICEHCGELILLGQTTVPPVGGVCKKCLHAVACDKIEDLISPSPIGLHEFLYPLMQGYDSVAMDVDGEIGGNDQTFNMLVGRDLMKSMKGKEKFVLANKLLTDTTGKKMGKSEGNMITLDDMAEQMFGKVMSWTDGMIVPGFELCKLEPAESVGAVEKRLKGGENPRDLKLELAEAIVKIYHGEKEAVSGRENFIKTFSKKETPDEMPDAKVAGMNITDALLVAGLVKSKGEARRAIEQGGVKIDGKVIETLEIVVKRGSVIQKGKRFFVKVV